MDDKKVKAYKVTRAEYPGRSCIYRDALTLLDNEFAGAEPGKSIAVTLVEMAEEELANLPETEGW